MGEKRVSHINRIGKSSSGKIVLKSLQSVHITMLQWWCYAINISTMMEIHSSGVSSRGVESNLDFTTWWIRNVCCCMLSFSAFTDENENLTRIARFNDFNRPRTEFQFQFHLIWRNRCDALIKALQSMRLTDLNENTQQLSTLSGLLNESFECKKCFFAFC